MCYLVRMLALTVRKAVEFFAKCRAPGIYKHYYIRWGQGHGWGADRELDMRLQDAAWRCEGWLSWARLWLAAEQAHMNGLQQLGDCVIMRPYGRRQLFRYHHEGMPPSFTMPPIPEWKGGDSPEREEEDVLDGALGRHMHHEDLIGEGVSCPAWVCWASWLLRLHASDLSHQRLLALCCWSVPPPRLWPELQVLHTLQLTPLSCTPLATAIPAPLSPHMTQLTACAGVAGGVH